MSQESDDSIGEFVIDEESDISETFEKAMRLNAVERKLSSFAWKK